MILLSTTAHLWYKTLVCVLRLDKRKEGVPLPPFAGDCCEKPTCTSSHNFSYYVVRLVEFRDRIELFMALFVVKKAPLFPDE